MKNNIETTLKYYLLDSTWSQMGHAPSLLRILLASSVPFTLLRKCYAKVPKGKIRTKGKFSLCIQIHKRWPHVVEMARPSSSRQHALHLISTVIYNL